MVTVEGGVGLKLLRMDWMTSLRDQEVGLARGDLSDRLGIIVVRS